MTLSLPRLYALRGGYLFMGLGLVLVKWPLLPDAHTMEFYESATLCWLVAMSLLALRGLRHPIRWLPVLLLETLWKVLWLGLVARPRAIGGDLDGAYAEGVVTCSLVVVIAAVVPWRHVWREYVRAPGDPFRRARPGHAAVVQRPQDTTKAPG